jgi:hypothetical protein
LKVERNPRSVCFTALKCLVRLPWLEVAAV